MEPWKTYHKDVVHIFEDSEWQKRTAKAPPLSHTECQMWATLQILLFDSDSINMYEINTARRNVLLKLRGHLDEAALSQVPSLEHIARWLATLAITAPTTGTPTTPYHYSPTMPAGIGIHHGSCLGLGCPRGAATSPSNMYLLWWSCKPKVLPMPQSVVLPQEVSSQRLASAQKTV
ncbi:uncharacterized protein LOC135102044 isoform X1 [Scylla paramamosain]|uniref:uncharacterized protein LOC135102044 isoform X1 n=1 Tax=Scylla paramamosain TaxID=85552 RepID=UPI0030832B6F